MNENLVPVECNLDLISFFSCGSQFDNFIVFLGNQILRKNAEISMKNNERNKFEIAIYNEHDKSVLVEYVFFAKTVIEFIKLSKELSREEIESIYGFLYFSNAKFHTDFRFIFLVGILGNLHRMNFGYFSNLSRKARNVYANRIVKNSDGNVAVARHIPFSVSLIEKHDLELFEELRSMDTLEVVAFGSKEISKYAKENNVETKYVFDIEKPKRFIETSGSFN